MKRLARVVLTLQLAGVAILGATQVSASAQPSAPASPTPAASTSSTAEPAPASPASSSSAPSPQPAAGSATPSPAHVLSSLEPPPSPGSPAPSASPSPTGPPATVAVTSHSLELIAQVGDEVHYRVTVSNPGEAPLAGVFVVDLLPSEVTFVSAKLLPEVEATLYNRFGGKESITWNVGDVAPGDSITMEWTGTATSAGDMTALNAVRAVAQDARRVRQESSTFLATTAMLGGANPAPSPTTTRVVTYERVPAGTTLGAPEAQPGRELPATGFDAGIAVALAALLMALGALTWWSAVPGPGRRRRIALALGALALLAACTTGQDSERAAPAPTGSPEVKGRRIGPGGEVRDLGEGRRNRDRPDESQTDTGSGPDAGPSPAPVTSPEPVTEPLTRLVRRVRVVAVDPALGPSVRLGSLDSATNVGYGWDGGSLTSVTSSASSATGSAAIETSLSGSGGVLTAVVTIANESELSSVVVDGRLHYEIRSSRGVASLSSAPLSVTLRPGGTTAVSFSYDLPAGTYSGAGSFRAH